MGTRRKASDHPHKSNDMPPHRPCRHTFEVHITGVPTGSPNPEYRWHGDFEHRHRGECVGGHESSRIEEMLKALKEQIGRLIRNGK